MNIINKNLRKLRAVKGLSQKAFGELVDISRHNIGAYEEGRSQPKMEVILHIAKIFSIDVELLMTKELTVNEIAGFKEVSTPILEKVTQEPLDKESVLAYLDQMQGQLNAIRSWIEKEV